MRQSAAVPLTRRGLAMGIFGDSGQRGRSAAKGYDFAANECLEVLCDRCHAAWAKVEVITRAGPVFFCQHHHKKYRPSLIAAGYQIRAVLLTEISALALTGKPDDRRPLRREYVFGLGGPARPGSRAHGR